MPVPAIKEYNGKTRGYVVNNEGLHHIVWFRIKPRFVRDSNPRFGCYARSYAERSIYMTMWDQEAENQCVQLVDRDECPPFPVITHNPKKAIVKIGRGGR